MDQLTNKIDELITAWQNDNNLLKSSLSKTIADWHTSEIELLHAIAFYALVVMTELEQDGENIVGHLIDSDDNPGQYLRNLLIKYGATLENTPYDFLLKGAQIEKGGYSSLRNTINIAKLSKRLNRLKCPKN